MPLSYSPNLKIYLMDTGSDTGLWGENTNTNLGDVIEQAITGQSTVVVADSATPTELISVPGESSGDTARSLYIKLTGSLTAGRTVQTIPANHFYIVENATTGGQSITFTCVSGGTSVTVPNGQKVLAYCDGTNVVTVLSYLPTLVTALTNSTVDSTPIGSVTPSSGVFTSGSAQTWNITVGGTLNGVTLTNATAAFNFLSCVDGALNATIGATTPKAGTFTALTSASGAINATIGATTPYSGAFTALSSSSVYTNTVIDGTAPMAITSTTRVNNLNVARSGYADTATVADTSTNATYYPTFVSATTGNLPVNVTSTRWSFNPSTGAMALLGTFSPTTLTPTNPLGIAYGGTGTTTGFIPPRVVTVASGTSITPNIDTTDIVYQNNSTSAGTLTLVNPTGTPVDGQKLIVRILCSNAQVLSFGTAYSSSSDLGFPASTSGSSKTDYMGFIYNSATSKWNLLAKVFGF